MLESETQIVKSYQAAIYDNYARNINLDEFHTIIGFILERREFESENKTKKTRKKKGRNG